VCTQIKKKPVFLTKWFDLPNHNHINKDIDSNKSIKNVWSLTLCHNNTILFKSIFMHFHACIESD